MALANVSFVGIGSPAVGDFDDQLTPALPPGVATGDLILTVGYFRVAAGTLNISAGWSDHSTLDVDPHYLRLWYRIATGDDTAPTIIPSGGVVNQNFHLAYTMAFRGADRTNPLGTPGAASNNGLQLNIGPIAPATATLSSGAAIVIGARHGAPWTGVDVLSGDGLTWVEAEDNYIHTYAGLSISLVTNYALWTSGPPTLTAKTFVPSGVSVDPACGRMFIVNAATIVTPGVGIPAATNEETYQLTINDKAVTPASLKYTGERKHLFIEKFVIRSQDTIDVDRPNIAAQGNAQRVVLPSEDSDINQCIITNTTDHTISILPSDGRPAAGAYFGGNVAISFIRDAPLGGLESISSILRQTAVISFSADLLPTGTQRTLISCADKIAGASRGWELTYTTGSGNSLVFTGYPGNSSSASAVFTSPSNIIVPDAVIEVAYSFDLTTNSFRATVNGLPSAWTTVFPTSLEITSAAIARPVRVGASSFGDAANTSQPHIGNIFRVAIWHDFYTPDLSIVSVSGKPKDLGHTGWRPRGLWSFPASIYLNQAGPEFKTNQAPNADITTNVIGVPLGSNIIPAPADSGVLADPTLQVAGHQSRHEIIESPVSFSLAPAGTAAFGLIETTTQYVLITGKEEPGPTPEQIFPPPHVSNMTLRWNDEFDGTVLDLYHPTDNPTGFWRFGDFSQDPLQIGYADPLAWKTFHVNPISTDPDIDLYDPIYVADGTLRIAAQRALLTDRPDLRTKINAQTATQGRPADEVTWLGCWISAFRDVGSNQAFRYGYVEARMRFPVSTGQFKAFKIFSSEGASNPTKGTAEISIVELGGLTDRWSTIVRKTSVATPITNLNIVPYSDDFHTYGLWWSSTFLRIYRDNILTWEGTGSDVTWFDAPMRVVFSVAMDANAFTGGQLTTAGSQSPQYVEIEWVRAWAPPAFAILGVLTKQLGALSIASAGTVIAPVQRFATLTKTLASATIAATGGGSGLRVAALIKTLSSATISSTGTIAATSRIATFSKSPPLVFVTSTFTASGVLPGNHFYVSTAGNASDSNPGTQAAPFRTIQRAANLVNPGHTVHVAPGTYSERVSISRSGTSSSHIKFVSDTKWGALIRPTGSGGSGWGGSYAFRVSAQWIEIDGFDITPASGASMNVGIYFVAPNNYAYRNKIYRISVSGMPEGPGGITAEAGTTNSTMVANHIYNIGFTERTHGIYIADGTGNMINNITGNIAGFGLHLWHTPSYVNIINNTCFNCAGGITVGAGEAPGANATGCVVANNVTYGNRLYQGIQTAGTVSNNIFTHNLCPDGIDISGTHTNTLTGNPNFVNYQASGTGDYRLAVGSPGINSGNATYAPSTDFLGNARPNGGAPDRGAYEFY